MTKHGQISLIITVLNEAGTINLLLNAIRQQTFPADEVIFVDGGSTDNTLQLIKVFADKNPHLKISCKIKVGNRSVGRNFAIHSAKNDWVAITDAGCIPRKDWLAELMSQVDQQAEVIAGYYAGQPSNPFQTAVVPYVLVMPDRVDPANFLPATRSMLIKKTIWQQLGGFNEKLNHNEDYDFARRLRDQNFKIQFAAQAVVAWLPVNNLTDFSRMIYRFARGDSEAHLLRPKVVFIFVRYLLLLMMIFLSVLSSSLYIWGLILLLGFLYAGWAIAKNFKYARQGWYWLPVLQVTADGAVIAGSLRGMLNW